MKTVVKISLAVIVVGVVLGLLPTVLPFPFSSSILYFKKFLSYFYCFVNPYTLQMCLLTILAVNSSSFIIRIVNFITDKISSAS